MKKYLRNWLLNSILLLACYNTSAQVSLVWDCSFEDTTTGWGTSYKFYDHLHHWGPLTPGHWMGYYIYLSTIQESPDHMRLPCMASNAGIIQCRDPRHGIALMALQNFAMYPVGTYPYKNSIVKGKLRSKLVAGKQYCATLHTNTDSFGSTAFSNGLSMYFDNGQLDTMYTIHMDSSGYYPFVKPQVQCPFKIFQTADWQKVQGVFTANGSEEYINIGRFQHDDSVQYTYYNIWGWVDTSQGIVIDDVSLIPLDITAWLHDTFCAIGDSVWVGLDWRDYPDGKWYTHNMNYLQSGYGFWFKPTQAVTKFIQEIDVCGTPKFDTMSVYAYPAALANATAKRNALYISPNPTSGGKLNITWPLYSFAQVQLEVIDSRGNCVLRKFAHLENGSFNEDLNVASGVYFIRLKHTDGNAAQTRLLVVD